MYLPAKVSDKTNSREVGKSTTLSYLNVLSQYQNYLGQKMARLARFPRRLFDTLAGSNHENKAGRFYLPAPKKRPALSEVASFTQSLTKANPEDIAMADKNIPPFPLPEQKSGNPDFDPKLSQLLDLLIQHEESLRAELIKTKQIRQQLENLIPNNPLKDFISSLDLDRSQ